MAMDNQYPLPLGVKFLPSNDEIIYYLRQWVAGNDQECMGIFHVVDIYEKSPWDLPVTHKHGSDREEPRMYYITERRRVNNSGRVNRSVGRDGHWHGQGGAKAIMVGSGVVGHMEQFQFKTGKGKVNNGTNWIMHEYTLPSPEKREFQKWAICVLHQKKDRRKLERLPPAPAPAPAPADTSTSTSAGVNIMVGEYDHNDELITNTRVVLDLQPAQICTSSAPPPPQAALLTNAPANIISEEEEEEEEEEEAAEARTRMGAGNVAEEIKQGQEWVECLLQPSLITPGGYDQLGNVAEDMGTDLEDFKRSLALLENYTKL